MNKIALVGGNEIKHYTIADELWENISQVTGVKFSFKIIPIADKKTLRKFYKKYQENDDFTGFNIALPWKSEIAKILKIKDFINTVYKNDNVILGANTDVTGIVKSQNYITNKKQFHKILILGAGGAGLATANYLSKNSNSCIYVYDICYRFKKSTSFIQLGCLDELKKQKYDLIINATPLGKYYNSVIKSFSSPIDLNILYSISTKNTVLQEMNYLPEKTLFLQFGDLLKLKTISGIYMLVFQALDSFEKYFGYKANKTETDRIIKNIVKYVHKKEKEILCLKTK